MNVGSDVDVYADVDVLELRIDQRVDTDAADAGLKRSGRNRNAVADLERGLLPVESANLRILDELGVAVVHHRRKIGGGNGDLEVGGVQVAQVFRLMLPFVPDVPVVPAVVLVVVLGGIKVALQRNRSAGRRADAQGPRLVFADLHDGDIDDDFGAGLVEVFDQLFRQCDLIGRAAHDDGILGEQLLHALHIEHGADGVDHVLQFGGLRKIRKIKSLEDALLEFLALGRIVGGDEDGIGRYRTPESFGFEGGDFQRLFQRDASSTQP